MFVLTIIKPVIIIVADDPGYADLLFNPQHPKGVVTPQLDAWAQESVIYRQGYASGGDSIRRSNNATPPNGPLLSSKRH